jgi:hypothetical protein
MIVPSAVAKVVAKGGTFAPEFCNAQSPVKREFCSPVQKLGVLQLYAE